MCGANEMSFVLFYFSNRTSTWLKSVPSVLGAAALDIPITIPLRRARRRWTIVQAVICSLKSLKRIAILCH
jgi:hypothetical protein